MSNDWIDLYEGIAAPHRDAGLFDQEEPLSDQSSDLPASIIAEKSPVHYQYKGQYIMTAVKSGLMIIDQHRAHVRILFEEYLSQMDGKSGNSQKLLFPEVVQLPPSDAVAFDSIIPDMEHIGFDISNLGAGSYSINGIPADLEGVNINTLIPEIVSAASSHTQKMKETVYQPLALCLARHAAIPRGQILGNEEMENLVNTLFSCSNVNYTPDGKIIICILKQEEIDQLMG